MSDFQIETYKSRITLSIEVIKLLATINGGGAIAVLTFAGNTGAKLNPGALRNSLIAYGAGLLLAVITALLAYIIQSLVDEKVSTRQPTLVFSAWAIFVGCLLVVASVASFAVGSLHAADAISAVAIRPAS